MRGDRAAMYLARPKKSIAWDALMHETASPAFVGQRGHRSQSKIHYLEVYIDSNHTFYKENRLTIS